jgi:hypothetical protein
MGPEFFKTPMGRRYYEHTLPELAKQLERIADVLEALLARLDTKEPEEGSKR